MFTAQGHIASDPDAEGRALGAVEFQENGVQIACGLSRAKLIDGHRIQIWTMHDDQDVMEGSLTELKYQPEQIPEDRPNQIRFWFRCIIESGLES